MPDLIVIAGAPGSGKTTIAKLLHARLDSVYFELGWLREFHLDPAWRRATPREEQMAFENLLFIVRNYFRYGYSNVIICDLEDFRVRQIPAHFAQDDYVIATLVVHDEAELKRRVLSPDRDSGYRDYEKALAWNRAAIARPPVRNESKIDNTEPTSGPALEQILALVNA